MPTGLRRVACSGARAVGVDVVDWTSFWKPASAEVEERDGVHSAYGAAPVATAAAAAAAATYGAPESYHYDYYDDYEHKKKKKKIAAAIAVPIAVATPFVAYWLYCLHSLFMLGVFRAVCATTSWGHTNFCQTINSIVVTTNTNGNVGGFGGGFGRRRSVDLSAAFTAENVGELVGHVADRLVARLQ